MKLASVLALGGVLVLVGCTESSRNPEAIRHDTAVATSSAARDTKAVVQGVFDGLKPHHGPLDINSASSGDLQTVPGIDGDTADRIVANRPYRSTRDLLRRHLVTANQYGKMESQITVR